MGNLYNWHCGILLDKKNTRWAILLSSSLSQSCTRFRQMRKDTFTSIPLSTSQLHFVTQITDKYALSSLSSLRLLPRVLQRLRPLSYSKSHIILIAFSIDTPDSLDNVLSKWIEEVRSICGPGIPVMLVGCKKDLRDDAVLRNDGSAEDERRFVSSQKVRFISLHVLYLCFAQDHLRLKSTY